MGCWELLEECKSKHRRTQKLNRVHVQVIILFFCYSICDSVLPNTDPAHMPEGGVYGQCYSSRKTDKGTSVHMYSNINNVLPGGISLCLLHSVCVWFLQTVSMVIFEPAGVTFGSQVQVYVKSTHLPAVAPSLNEGIPRLQSTCKTHKRLW